MATDAQIKANRANAQKSSGAKTEEGQARSAQNARKHGFYASNPVFGPEEQQQFDEAFHCLTRELEPITYLEHRLVREMAVADYRLQRARQMEYDLFQRDYRDHALNAGNGEPWTHGDAWQRLCKSSNLLQLLSLQKHFERTFNRAMAELKAMRLRAERAEGKEEVQSYAEFRKQIDAIAYHSIDFDSEEWRNILNRPRPTPLQQMAETNQK